MDEQLLINETIGLNTTIFIILILSFSIKVPLIGLHGWLPIIHLESSTMGRLLLSSLLLKLGGIGIILTLFFHCINYSIII